MTGSCALALLLAVALVGRPAAAQSPAERQALLAWRDSLDHVINRDVLRNWHSAMVGELDAGVRPRLAVFRLALLEDRLAQLDGFDDGEVADALRGVTEDHPDWPIAWSEYALANLRDARSGAQLSFTLQQALGFDPVADLVEPFVRGAAADSTWTEGLSRLASRAIHQDDDVVRQVALRALRGAGNKVVAADPRLAIWRGQIERLIGDPDSALTAIEAAALTHPNNPAVLRMQARLRFVYGRADGADPWYRGLALANGVALAEYRHDLAGVVPDSLLDRLPQQNGEQRVAMMRQFWSSRDIDGLPSGPDRLAEQYRRVDYAWTYYVRQSLRDTLRETRAIIEIDTLPLSALDARGRVMLRHGTPVVRTSIGNSGGPDVERTLGIVGMPKNETWRYVMPRGEQLFFHFYVPDGQRDYVNAESIMDLLAATNQYRMFRSGKSQRPGSDTVAENTYGGELVATVAQELLRSRMALSPLYADMLNQGKGGADSLQRRERAIGRAALASEGQYSLGFELPLDAAIDILNVGTDAEGPVVQISFAIPGSSLSPRSLPTGVVYPVRMRLGVLDSLGQVVMQLDTTRHFVTRRALRGGQYLLGQQALHLTPGQYRIRAALESDRRGTLSRSTVLTVVDPQRAAPTLSDLSLGRRTVAITWRAGSSDTAWADPRHRFPRDAPMELYFEAGGMNPGTAYTIDLAIDRSDEDAGCLGRGSKLTLRFSQQAEAGVNRFQRAVSLDRLEPGAYVLAVTATTASGAETRRCRSFEVIE